MPLFKRKSPLDREWEKLLREEEKFIAARITKEPGALDRFLEEKVPDKLQDTLNTAFLKAFALIFEKGTGVIEKTCRAEEKRKTFAIDNYTDEMRQSRKTLRSFSKKASSAGTKNILISGAAGIGMGAVGVGLPDIPVFTALMLKNIYETAMSYGYGYRSAGEQHFILMVIEAAVAQGEHAADLDTRINNYIKYKLLPSEEVRQEQLRRTAEALSNELLYMKFLQGIPVVGAVGGAYDVIYMKRIGRYARLKYCRRFLLRKRASETKKQA